MRALALLLLLSACDGAPSEPPAAPPRTAPADALLYEVVIEQADGRVSGTRVYGDGRLDVATPQPGTVPPVAWKTTDHLSPEVVTALLQALDAPELRELPDELPGDNRDAEAPKAQWTLRLGDTTRQLRSPAWSGIRIPQLEVVDRALRTARGPDPLSTTWTLVLPDHQQQVTMPCSPLQTRQLRTLAAMLLDPKLPPPESSERGAPLLRIDWKQDHLSWSTELLDNGVVNRIPADGKANAYLLAPASLLRIQTVIASTPWADAASFCPQP